jgi:hypothetical protein
MSIRFVSCYLLLLWREHDLLFAVDVISCGGSLLTLFFG